MNFLIKIMSHKNNQNPIVPLGLQERLAESQLLLLGYQLKDWDLRVLFRFLLDYRQREKYLQERGMVIQLKEPNKKELGDVVLVDILEGIPQGKALDLFEAAPVEGFDARVIGSNGYDETKDSNVVIVTSGVPRKPGMRREDLLDINRKIIESVVTEVISRSPNAILIMVTNPLDTMTYLAIKKSGLPRERIMGNGGNSGYGPLPVFHCDGIGNLC